MDFLDHFLDIRLIQLLACTDSIVLALVLMLIKVQGSEYSKRIGDAKNIIAASFLIFGAIMIFNVYKYDDVWDYRKFSSLMMLISVTYSSIAISYSMINLLESKAIPDNRFLLNIIVETIVAIGIVEGFFMGSDKFLYKLSLWIAVGILISQGIYYIILFDQAYKKSIKALENYFDEDEEHKIKWIRFCYIIAMLTNLFLLVYLLLDEVLKDWQWALQIYIIWYILFMVYFTSNFISFLGSHKLVLDAVAHRALSGQDRFQNQKKGRKNELQPDGKRAQREFAKLEQNLDNWVANKKYREYDKTREEIADELNTSKEIMQLYFAKTKRQDFRSWRNDLRMEDAKTMLLENKDLSINVIGSMCGFSDRGNFHRLFVKATGLSPKEWRDQNQN